MEFITPASQLIPFRFSCRSFERTPIDPAVREQLVTACGELKYGLLGETARVRLLEPPLEDFKRLKLGGGTISSGAGLLACATGRSELDYVSCGYLLEQAVLKATDLGLASCWIGYFVPAAIQELNISTDEVCPALAVVGNLPSGPSLKDRLIRTAVGATRRLNWDSIFFREFPGEKLNRGQTGDYAVALDMVRYAPSAGNRQPWRVGKARSIPVFNFYLKPVNPRYDRHHMHDVDLGIAICHFELGAREMKLTGRWQILEPAAVPPVPGARYIITWLGD